MTCHVFVDFLAKYVWYTKGHWRRNKKGNSRSLWNVTKSRTKKDIDITYGGISHETEDRAKGSFASRAKKSAWMRSPGRTRNANALPLHPAHFVLLHPTHCCVSSSESRLVWRKCCSSGQCWNCYAPPRVHASQNAYRTWRISSWLCGNTHWTPQIHSFSNAGRFLFTLQNLFTCGAISGKKGKWITIETSVRSFSCGTQNVGSLVRLLFVVSMSVGLANNTPLQVLSWFLPRFYCGCS